MSKPPQISGLDKDGVLAASLEAEKEVAKFNPQDRAKYVRERVDEIRNLVSFGKKQDEIKTIMGDFVTNYPTLFQYAVKKDFDMNQMNKYIEILSKINNGLSLHNASVKVGQLGVDKFIKPTLR